MMEFEIGFAIKDHAYGSELLEKLSEELDFIYSNTFRIFDTKETYELIIEGLDKSGLEYYIY